MKIKDSQDISMLGLNLLTINLIVAIVLTSCYIINFIKFTDCDFKEDYKCEIIHGLGLIPVFTPFTVGFAHD